MQEIVQAKETYNLKFYYFSYKTLYLLELKKQQQKTEKLLPILKFPYLKKQTFEDLFYVVRFQIQ